MNICLKNIFSPAAAVLFSLQVTAQIQQPVPLPRQTIAKPTANVKLLELANVIEGRWRGTFMVQNPGSVMVDSIWMAFKKDGTLSFKHQQYEFNGPVTGTYSVLKNAIEIHCNKAPFSHIYTGTWNINNGIISGTSTTVRAKDASQPPYYKEGTDNGTFTLMKY